MPGTGDPVGTKLEDPHSWELDMTRLKQNSWCVRQVITHRDKSKAEWERKTAGRDIS